MCDVYFYEAFEAEADALERGLGDLRAGMDWRTIQEAGHATPPAPVISIRTQSAIPLAWAAQLRAVLTRSTGYDHVKAYRSAAGRADLACGYLPLYCNRAVAEQAALLWMALLRKLPRQTGAFATFHRDGMTGRECQGRGLAVVGVGNIGAEVARIGRGLGMAVVGVDLAETRDDIEYVSLDEALGRADVVVCCMNLTPDNVGYFGYERLRRFRRGAVFVNVARGEMGPARDLLRALEQGMLGGVGLDVYNDEPELAVALRAGGAPPSDEARAAVELSRRADAILTPHNAFNTQEAVERKAGQSIEQARRVLAGDGFSWPVPDLGAAPGRAPRSDPNERHSDSVRHVAARPLRRVHRRQAAQPELELRGPVLVRAHAQHGPAGRARGGV